MVNLHPYTAEIVAEVLETHVQEMGGEIYVRSRSIWDLAEALRKGGRVVIDVAPRNHSIQDPELNWGDEGPVHGD